MGTDGGVIVIGEVRMVILEDDGRYYPTGMREAPLPGPPSKDKPKRWKSIGSHPDGFSTLDEALAECDSHKDRLGAQLTKILREPIEHEGCPDAPFSFAWE